MDTVAVSIAAVVGLAWGLISDRIAARWPDHEDGSVRRVDWRTPIVALVGAVAAVLLVGRYGDDTPRLVLLGIVVVLMTLMFATDLDQRLLPDVLTYPVAVVAVVAFVTSVGPFVRSPSDLLVAAAAAVGLPLALYLLAIPFGAGAIGMGDLKLLFGFGLLAGVLRLVAAVVVGAVAAAVVIVVLLAARRITLHTYIPYGPFLIIGALFAILRPIT
jgi:leader peptidase (prepilin peptidase)/N-methyltransferase